MEWRNEQIKPGLKDSRSGQNGSKSQKESQPILREGFTTDELAAVVARDPILTNEVCEILCCTPQIVYAIPFEELPFIWVNEKKRLYSRRLVIQFLSLRHKKTLKKLAA